MHKLSDQILKLLQGGLTLKEARLKALKITNEIQGFGCLDSPSSSSSSSSSDAQASSFCSFSSSSTPTYIDSLNDQTKSPFSPTKETNITYSPGGTGDIDNTLVFRRKNATTNNHNYNEEENNFWNNGPSGNIDNKDCLMSLDNNKNDVADEKSKEKPKGFVKGICSKLVGSANALRGNGPNQKIDFRCLSDVGTKGSKRRLQRQYSLWY